MPHPPSILDALESVLAVGLRRDARALGRAEATVRVVLSIAPGEAVPMSEVARRVVRDRSTVTRFVQRALREGLVEQTPGAEDRRTRLLSLSPAGGALREEFLRLRTSRSAALKEEIRAKTGLGAEEVEWFLTALLESLGPAA
jgi:DNA-binding MarR family transcriptional regulator